MAKKVVLLDDLDQSVIDEGLGGGTVEFSFDNKHYTIDLGVKNRDAFRKDMDKWVKAASEVEAPRRASTSSRKRAPSGSGYPKETLAAIREWSAKNGRELPSRGRVPQDVIAAWEKSHESSSAG